jgi:hypothetical protein
MSTFSFSDSFMYLVSSYKKALQIGNPNRRKYLHIASSVVECISLLCSSFPHGL